jgi:hypothetical protein
VISVAQTWFGRSTVSDRERAQQIGEDGMRRMRLACPRPAIDGGDPHALHQRPDVIAADRLALAP